MKTLREEIYDTINVWGTISFPYMEQLLEKRFRNIPDGIAWDIILNLLEENLLVKNVNYTLSTREYWEEDNINTCHI